MGILRFLRRASWDRERRAEIEAYLQIETDENIARGMASGEASAAARRKLGNSTLIREEIYRMNTINFLETCVRDVRYGFRMLRRSPMFTAVALLTLGIGIGANTAVFTVVNSVLIKPLPYPDAEDLVAVWHKAPGAPGLADLSGDLLSSLSMYVTYAEQNRVFQAIGAWASGTMSITGLAEPEQVRTVFVSDGALQALSVPPLLGRWLSKSDQVPGGPATALLSYGYWQRRFGGDRSVVGRKITVDSSPREIVGVMPQGFRFINTDADLIVPLAFKRNELILPGFGYQCVARLKPGQTIGSANADLARLVPVWMRSWPAPSGIDSHVWEQWRITPALRPLKNDVVGSTGNVLWVLMGTIGIVMLIAVANVANLLLVRADTRRQEFAVRAALGAGWRRIVRALLIESVLLGVMGGALGLGLAYAGLRWLTAIGPGNLPRLDEISLDSRALLFAIGVSLLSAALCGVLPALKYAGPTISVALRAGGRSISDSRERHRIRNLLVVGQVALALVLLVSSGLMIRTFQALRRVPPGFTGAERIQIVRTSIPDSLVREPERVIRIQNDIVDRLRAIPGVESAGFASEMPMEGIPPDWDVIVDSNNKAALATRMPPLRMFKTVSPGLFQTSGTTIVAGRDYTWADLYGRRPVAIVSESLARELWGTPRAALGKQISTAMPRSPWREVIGVVENVRENGVQEPAPAIVYWPSFGENLYVPGRVMLERTVSFVVRSRRAGTERLLRQISQAVWSVNASLPLASVRTMQDVYQRSLARTSFALIMLATASATALLLGLIGIYGVISYVVSQRRREIGIRVALGAQRADLRRMFVRYGLTMAGLGIVLGLCAAAGLTQLMKSLLFGTSTLDPLTYAAVAVVLLAASTFASYLPARRAAAVDPIDSLKAE